MQSQKPDSQRQSACCNPVSLPVQSWVWAGLGMGAIVPALVSQSPTALAASLSSWHYDTSVNQLVLTVKDNTNPRYFLIAQPARIVVDLPDTAIDNQGGQKTYNGAVRSIRVSPFQKGSTRIVMELSPDISLAPGQVKLEKTGTTSGGTRWVLKPLIANPSTSRPPTSKATPPLVPVRPQTVVPQPTNQKPLATLPSSPAAKTPVSSGLPANSANLKPLLPPSSLAAKPISTSKPIAPSAPSSDAGVVVDTSGAVPITVPPPEKAPAPKATPPSVPMPRGAATPTPLPVPTLPTPSPVSATPKGTATSPLPVPPSSSTPPVAMPKGAADSFLEIPSTIAQATPSATPTITVPPLGNPSAEIVSPEGSSPFPPAPAVTPPPSTSVVVPSLPEVVLTAPKTPKRSSVSPLPTAPVADFDSGSLPPAPDFPPARNSFIPGTSPGAAAVNVPPLQPMPSSPILVPPSTPDTSSGFPGSAAVNVPPQRSMPVSPVLVPPPENSGTPQAPVPPTDSHIVDFGQPLPTATKVVPYSNNIIGVPNSSVFAYRSSATDVLLAAGTTLELRYPGTNPLKLEANRPTQEVLLLQSDIRDTSGRLIAPAGTPVVGRFETTPAGSHFVAQAISLGGRNVPLVAQSDSLGGSRQLSNGNLVRNAGIGVLAGGLIGGLAGGSAGVGVLGGAAAGAATTFFTSPKTATIQPGQAIQVRLSQDLHR